MTHVSGTRFPVLADLADKLSVEADRLVEQWTLSHLFTTEWVAGKPDLLAALRVQLRALPPPARAEVAAASRETTTHFAWQLMGDHDLPFSFWLHEYKPQRDWWRGYANSVHNHRYHFCSVMLAGGFQHEWYEVGLDPTGELVRTIRRLGSEAWRPGGPVRAVAAEEFHRVARAIDGTVTFVVKSRPVRGWSLSVDPDTKVSRRHIPVEDSIEDLADRI